MGTQLATAPRHAGMMAGLGQGSTQPTGTYMPVTVSSIRYSRAEVNTAIGRLRAPMSVGTNCVTAPVNKDNKAKYLRHLAAKAVFDEFAWSGHGKTLVNFRQGAQIRMTDAQITSVRARAWTDGARKGAWTTARFSNNGLIFLNNNASPSHRMGNVQCTIYDGVQDS